MKWDIVKNNTCSFSIKTEYIMLQQVFTKNSLQADAISAAQHRNTLSEIRERILVLFHILWDSASHYSFYQR